MSSELLENTKKEAPNVPIAISSHEDSNDKVNSPSWSNKNDAAKSIPKDSKPRDYKSEKEELPSNMNEEHGSVSHSMLYDNGFNSSHCLAGSIIAESPKNDTVVEIYEIEYSDENDQNDSINISALLRRSLSLSDLPTISESDSNIEIEKDISEQLGDVNLLETASGENLSKASLLGSSMSFSENDEDEIELINDLEEENDFLKQAEKDLEMYRQEQVISYL